MWLWQFCHCSKLNTFAGLRAEHKFNSVPTMSFYSNMFLSWNIFILHIIYIYIVYIHIQCICDYVSVSAVYTLTIELCLQTYQYHFLSDESSGIQLFGWLILAVNRIWNHLDGIPLSVRVFWEFLLRKEDKICMWSEPERPDWIIRETGGSKSPASFSLLSGYRCRGHPSQVSGCEPWAIIKLSLIYFCKVFRDLNDESN